MGEQAAASHLTPGTVLAGKYAVIRQLGRGGMGVVVEAMHLELDERVAIKFLLPDFMSHPEAAQRFTREARAAVKIKSEHVARVLDVGKLEQGEPYMVMEYLDGEDLSARIKRLGPLDIEVAIDFVLQASEALAEAHSYGIIHRDLKPANLFESKRPDGTPIIKVLDFGISKMASSDSVDLTSTTATMGSAYYMSPEQMESTRSVDARADVYSLGVTLFEILAGRPPFLADTYPAVCGLVLMGKAANLLDLRPSVPPALALTVRKAFALERQERFESIAALALALAPFSGARSQVSVSRIGRMAKDGRLSLTPATASLSLEESGGDSQSGPKDVAHTERLEVATGDAVKASHEAGTTAAALSATSSPARNSRTPILLGIAVLAIASVVVAYAVHPDQAREPAHSAVSPVTTVVDAASAAPPHSAGAQIPPPIEAAPSATAAPAAPSSAKSLVVTRPPTAPTSAASGAKVAPSASASKGDDASVWGRH